MAHGRETALAFLLGVVAGGVTALLLAPDRGEETRRKLRQGAHNLSHRGGEAIGTARGALGDKAHKIAETAREKVDQVASSTRSQIDAVRGAVAQGKEAYKREVAGRQSE